MGYYIQTGDLKKVEGINKLGGVEVQQPKKFEDIPSELALIVVVDNGLFDAAGLIYSPEEFEAFTMPEDRRPKKFFYVDKKLAYEKAGYKP